MLRAIALVLTCCSFAFSTTNDELAIRKVLSDQVRAWNAHDLPGYMSGYWKSADLTFYSGATVTRGWQATLERYQQRYQGQGREMGTLAFEIFEVHVFSRDAVVYGKWRLNMSDGKEPHGLFTLVLKKFPEGWRIVHDHTSAE